jgi:hypothetical protein
MKTLVLVIALSATIVAAHTAYGGQLVETAGPRLAVQPTQHTQSARTIPPSHRRADTCTFARIAFALYSDWSELYVFVQYCTESHDVVGCGVQPGCNDGGPSGVAVALQPGTSAPAHTWDGVGPCMATVAAQQFVCPVNLDGTVWEPYGGPDVQH